jgi:phage-related protein
MFDAGAIVARVEIDERAFNASIDRVEARLRRLADQEIHIKVVADYDASQAEHIRRAFSDLDRRITRDMVTRNRTSGGGFFGMLTSMFSRAGGAGAAAGGPGAAAQTAQAAGPGMMGMGGTPAMWIGGGAVATSLLPALLGVGGTAIGGAGGLGVAGLLGMQVAKPAMGLASAQEQAQQAMAAAVTPAQQKAALTQLQAVNQQVHQLSPALQSIFGSITKIQSWWENLTKSMAPMLAGPLHQVAGMITQLSGPIKSMFAGAMTVVVPFVRVLVSGLKEILPLLGSLFRASAPGFAALTGGLLSLVKNILPGLITLVKATAPYMKEFAGTLARLGTDLGKMFAAMAPAVGPSMRILDLLLRAVGSLLPVIGRLAAIMARALAPVIGAFAQAIKILLPALEPVMKILSQLAGAILTDLMAILIPVAHLLADLAPSFNALAKVLGQVFNTLENNGTIWHVFANALEHLAKPLANVINALVVHLAPFIPPLMKLIGALADDAIMILVKVVEALAPPLIKIIEVLLPPLLKFVQALTPVIIVLADAFANGLAVALVAILDALTPIIVLAAKLLGWIAGLIDVVVKWLAQNHLLIPVLIAVAAAIDPVGTAIVVLITVIGWLAKHWRQAWQDIKNWAKDAWDFLTHGWGQWLVPGLTLIRKAVEFVRDHWHQAWEDIKHAGKVAWDFIDNYIVQPMERVFTQDLPNAFKTAVKWIGQHWNDLEGVIKAPVKFVIDDVLDGLIKVFDWITSKVGLGKPIGILSLPGLQHGGRIPGYGGGDRLPALLEAGETVVSKEHSNMLADLFAAIGVPGYQTGGKVGQHPIGAAQIRTGLDPSKFHGTTGGGLFSKIADIGKITAAIFSGNSVALSNAMMDMLGHHGVGGATAELARLLTAVPHEILHDLVAHLISLGAAAGGGLAGRGADVAKYAMSFAGKVPYVWGGTAVPGGADCSGFVTAIYHHFGIDPPRTSEAQGAWVKKSSAITGGLAFYNSPAGGPPPGHVAIVGFGGNVISQGGGMGPQIVPIRSMPFMFTGVPPGGAGYGPGNLRGLESIWQAGGGPPSAAHVAAAIGMAESGGREIKQQGQPPLTTGWGIWQITPTSGIWQNGRFGNLLNDSNNARAAVYLYRAAGDSFSPWATYNSGAYQKFMDSGGWLLPGATVAMNATGMREAVLAPRESQAFTMMAKAAHSMINGRGGGGFGNKVAEVMNIMLPEGTTLAQMMAELVFRVKAAELAGTAGAIR